MGDNIARTTSQIANNSGDVDQATHDDGDLHKIQDGNGEHAAEHGIGEHDGGAEDHAFILGDQSVGNGKKYQAQCFDLCGYPTQIRHHNGECAQPFDGMVVAQAVIVANGQQIKAIEFGRKEKTRQDEAERSAEWVSNDTA